MVELCYGFIGGKYDVLFVIHRAGVRACGISKVDGSSSTESSGCFAAQAHNINVMAVYNNTSSASTALTHGDDVGHKATRSCRNIRARFQFSKPRTPNPEFLAVGLYVQWPLVHPPHRHLPFSIQPNIIMRAEKLFLYLRKTYFNT